MILVENVVCARLTTLNLYLGSSAAFSLAILRRVWAVRVGWKASVCCVTIADSALRKQDSRLRLRRSESFFSLLHFRPPLGWMTITAIALEITDSPHSLSAPRHSALDPLHSGSSVINLSVPGSSKSLSQAWHVVYYNFLLKHFNKFLLLLRCDFFLFLLRLIQSSPRKALKIFLLDALCNWDENSFVRDRNLSAREQSAKC
jgi:hypothetical protein